MYRCERNTDCRYGQFHHRRAGLRERGEAGIDSIHRRDEIRTGRLGRHRSRRRIGQERRLRRRREILPVPAQKRRLFAPHASYQRAARSHSVGQPANATRC